VVALLTLFQLSVAVVETLTALSDGRERLGADWLNAVPTIPESASTANDTILPNVSVPLPGFLPVIFCRMAALVDFSMEGNIPFLVEPAEIS
jgi:hypothetical protein